MDGKTSKKGTVSVIGMVLICFVLTLSGLNCSGDTSGPGNLLEREVNSFQELQTHFRNPPAVFRTAPFWVWNDRVTEGKIDRQLRQFKEEDIGGVFIHPRMGLITPYLSDRWQELCAYAVERAKALDMKVYLYDENAFPSGFAGGHVPAEMPASVNQGHGLELIRSDTLPRHTADEYPLILRKSGGEFVEITGQADAEAQDGGSYYLFKKVFYEKNDPWHGGFSYVDLLMPEVTETFIGITMSGYERNFEEEFGQTVPAVFSDEANVEYPDVDNSIRWTPDLFNAFEERWGYDLKTKLPLLYEETGNWRQVRHNYYSLLGDLFIERWAEPYSEYARQHNLMWTGHHFEHDWPKPKNGGDWAALAAWQQMPGIDILFNRYTEKLEGVNTQFGNARGVRALSSVANQMGRNRALSETYGGAGWNLTFRDMKRIADWEYVLGVNFLNQHLSYMTIKGARKRDYPPSFSYHAPWWELYGVLGDYYARLSLALSAGEQINRTLVLVPTTSAWMYFAPSGTPSHADFYKIGDCFQKFVSDLEAFQVEYDLGSERIIRDRGSVREGRFVVGERSYDLVVFPPGLQSLNQHTVELIGKYLDNGGKILSVNSHPGYIDGAPSDTLSWLQSHADSRQWIQVSGLDLAVINEHMASEDFRISRPDTSSGKLFHRRMQLNDGEILFLVNTSGKEPAGGTVEMTGQSVRELDLLTGDIRSYPSETAGQNVQFSFELPPVGSLLLFIGENPAAPGPVPVPPVFTGGDVIKAEGPLAVRHMESNVLTLDYVDLSLGDREEKNMYYAEAAEKIFRHHGFEEGNPWYMAVQYKTEILDRNHFDEETGFTAAFHFSVDGLNNAALNSLQAVVERPRLWRVSVNGNTVTPIPGEWWLDRAFGVYDIGRHVRQGDNRLTLHASPMTVFSELERIYILGDFMLKPAAEGWKMVPEQPLSQGAWSRQGMPFYSDRVSYTKNYQLSVEDNSRFVVRLNEWKGTVAEVNVSSAYAGIIGWPPYELDITEFVHSGENKIDVVVYGSLKNLLGPHHNNPRRWRVSPGDFGDAPEHQPAGGEYDVIGYGLMEDFELIKKDKE